MLRKDGRDNENLRDVVIQRGVSKYAEGSCLIQMGDTHVLCTASVDEQVPRWLKESDQGWVTGEYAMLPRATADRTQRESSAGRRQGRGMEIERLIGRSLRAVTNLKSLGQRTITVDCDVLQADGGTRCAAITGGYVALAEACSFLVRRKRVKTWPLQAQVAALSLGLVAGEMMLDLTYEEDSRVGRGHEPGNDQPRRRGRGPGHRRGRPLLRQPTGADDDPGANWHEATAGVAGLGSGGLADLPGVGEGPDGSRLARKRHARATHAAPP